MSFLQAAYEILKEAGKPLHYREITRIARERGLIRTQGKTPEATMRAQLGTRINEAAQAGSSSLFCRVGPGVFGLTEWENAAPEGVSPPAIEPAIVENEATYLSYKDAALQVLREAGQPLHFREMARIAVEERLINPQGLTPDATMGAQLYSDVKLRGSASSFRREGRGVFALAEWEQGTRGVVRQAMRQRQEVKRSLLQTLRDMPPTEFEQLAGRLLGAMGYENIEVTRRSSDGGVDVLAEIEVGVLRLRTAVQVKRTKTNVQRPVVSQLRGDMALWDVDQGMVITTGGFSTGAKQAARVRNASPISLIDGDRVTDLLIEHEIGVRKELVEVVAFAPDRLGDDD